LVSCRFALAFSDACASFEDGTIYWYHFKLKAYDFYLAALAGFARGSGIEEFYKQDVVS